MPDAYSHRPNRNTSIFVRELFRFYRSLARSQHTASAALIDAYIVGPGSHQALAEPVAPFECGRRSRGNSKMYAAGSRWLWSSRSRAPASPML